MSNATAQLFKGMPMVTNVKRVGNQYTITQQHGALNLNVVTLTVVGFKVVGEVSHVYCANGTYQSDWGLLMGAPFKVGSADCIGYFASAFA